MAALACRSRFIVARGRNLLNVLHAQYCSVVCALHLGARWKLQRRTQQRSHCQPPFSCDHLDDLLLQVVTSQLYVRPCSSSPLPNAQATAAASRRHPEPRAALHCMPRCCQAPAAAAVAFNSPASASDQQLTRAPRVTPLAASKLVAARASMGSIQRNSPELLLLQLLLLLQRAGQVATGRQLWRPINATPPQPQPNASNLAHCYHIPTAASTSLPIAVSGPVQSLGALCTT